MCQLDTWSFAQISILRKSFLAQLSCNQINDHYIKYYIRYLERWSVTKHEKLFNSNAGIMCSLQPSFSRAEMTTNKVDEVWKQIYWIEQKCLILDCSKSGIHKFLNKILNFDFRDLFNVGLKISIDVDWIEQFTWLVLAHVFVKFGHHAAERDYFTVAPQDSVLFKNWW